MRIQTVPLRVFPTLKRVQKLSSPAVFSVRHPPSSVCLALSSGGDVLHVSSHSRCVVAPTSTECSRFLPAGGHLDLMGRLLPVGSSMVVRCVPSAGGSSSRLSTTNPVSVHRHLGFGLGCFSGRRPAVWFVVSGLLQLFYQPPGAVSGALRYPGFSPQSSGPPCCSLHRQHNGADIPEEAGGTRSQTINSVAQTILCLYEVHHIQLLPQFIPGKLNVLADSLSSKSQVLGSEWTVLRSYLLVRLFSACAVVPIFITFGV